MPHRHHTPGARIFVRSTSFVSPDLLYGGAKKLLRKMKNESWAMRPRPYKSDSRSWRNLLCEIVQFGLLGGAHACRVLVSASRRNNLFLTREPRGVVSCEKGPRSRDGLASMRDACDPQSGSLRSSSCSLRSFARHRKPLRHLHQAKRRLNKWSSRQPVLIFHSINRRPA